VVLATSLFGGPGAAERPGDGPAQAVGQGCATAVRDEIAAIDQARTLASHETDGALARQRYADQRSARHGKTADGACAADPHAADVLAALARFDRAAQAQAGRDADELSPVRRAAQSFIRVPKE